MTFETICPHCGELIETERPTVLDAQQHPDEKQRILDLDYFRLNCESCGETFVFSYPLLYMDPKQKTAIRLYPAASELAYPLPLPEGMQFDRMRDVASIHSLKEKIMIFNAGLNDVPVELLKILTIQQNPDRFDLAESDVLLLADADDDALTFFALAKDGRDFLLKTPIALYEQMEDECENLHLHPPKDFTKIDGEWITNRVKMIDPEND